MEVLTLKQLFLEQFNVPITLTQIQQTIKYVMQYEVRGDNMIAFNTPLLAVNKAYFLGKDSDAIFDIFHIYKTEFNKAIKRCTSINTSFNVTGNDFNLLVIWLCYLLGKTNFSKQVIYEGRVALLKLLHYKFFTGKVATMFKHGAILGVMQYTIDNLSAKCDIKKPLTNTWKLLILNHVQNVLDPNMSIHMGVFDNFQPDKAIAYSISDMHTRLSTKIINVALLYYKNHAAGKSIGSVDSTFENELGEKLLKAMKITLDNKIIQLQNIVLNVNRFLNFNDIKLVAGLTNIRPLIVRDVLTIFSSLSTMQYKARTGDQTIMDKQKQKIYVGYNILLALLIQKTYRRCAATGCNMKSNILILLKTRDMYRASRILDPDILIIKNSVDYFISLNTKYTRLATAVAARTAFILYVIIQSFKY